MEEVGGHEGGGFDGEGMRMGEAINMGAPIDAIYKTSWGRYIDLSRINSISECDDGFTIDMQLQDKPLSIMLWDYAIMRLYKKGCVPGIEFMISLQKEIVDAWTAYKQQNK